MVQISLLSFATKLKKNQDLFEITLVNRLGVHQITAKALVLSTGCKERTAKQIAIHGTRPAGVYTAGAAQYYTNVCGKLPTKKCVILGSGDIGLIMARRLTLEGAKVEGVYEAKSTPSGLSRNIAQCLHDFDIPLYTSHTVTRVYGDDRLEAVQVCKVDEKGNPIAGSEQKIDCDCLILSVGLIPENEIAQSLGVQLDKKSKGPVVDQQYQSNIDGIFVCGNALHVNDLVDFVTRSGVQAGNAAANYAMQQHHDPRIQIELQAEDSFLYVVPQKIEIQDKSDITIYFRSRQTMGKCCCELILDGICVFSKTYAALQPPEMQKLVIKASLLPLTASSQLCMRLQEVSL